MKSRILILDKNSPGVFTIIEEGDIDQDLLSMVDSEEGDLLKIVRNEGEMVFAKAIIDIRPIDEDDEGSEDEFFIVSWGVIA